MLNPRFIPESVFYTQSAVRSPQFVSYTNRITTLCSLIFTDSTPGPVEQAATGKVFPRNLK